MTSPPPAGHYILVAIDASPQSLRALETAARIAARLAVELRAVYVEDINLLRTAELPFANVIAASGARHPLTKGSLERQLHRQAEIARQAVETAGVRSHVAYSFSVVRGRVSTEIARAASDAVVVTVGRAGWSVRSGARLGSVARSLMEEGAASLLMVEQDAGDGPLVAVFDGSPASERALHLAAATASGDPPFITVLIAGDFEALQPRAAMLLQGSRAALQFQSAGADPMTLTERLRRSSARIVIMPISIFPDPGLAPAILETLQRSVFLVR